MAPTGHRVGLTATSLGLVAALDRVGTAVGYTKPIVQPRTSGDDNSVVLVRLTTRLELPASIPVESAEQLLGQGRVWSTRVDMAVARALDADVLFANGIGGSDDQPAWR